MPSKINMFETISASLAGINSNLERFARATRLVRKSIRGRPSIFEGRLWVG
jgi:hypothetical protein